MRESIPTGRFGRMTRNCKRNYKRLGSGILAILLIQSIAPLGSARAADTDRDLGLMSIEELLEIEVTSVSKHPQKVSEAPAAITVLTGEDIRRSGVTSVPEALRMVPGMHVAQIDGNKWAITSRGFNDQFANKLLVLIDGRSVYTPLFSGVFWDIQDVMLEDVDRIEVVRGPGGTLWGANAVNGVINIITKSAAETQGSLVSVGSGSIERYFTQARIGGTLGENTHYRVYAKYFTREDLADEPGGAANDDWSMTRGGFRMDWDAQTGDSLTFQGDYYGGEENEVLLGGFSGGEKVSGGNLLTRWDHEFEDGSAAHLQVYYDNVQRKVENIIRADRDTVDIELQHRFSPRADHTVVVGAGYRVTIDDLSSGGVSFSPESRTDHLVSGFIQDEVAVIEDWLTLTVGSKFEHNDYSGWEFQPSGRALLTPHDRHSLWAAISRAVRTPSRADNDVAFITPSTVSPGTFDVFSGNRSLRSDDLLAYELGYRGQLLDSFSLDLAAYYNDYDDLRSTDVTSPVPVVCPPPLPAVPICNTLLFGNNLDAAAWGFEADGTWTATSFWQISGGYTYRRIQVDRSSSTDVTAAGLEGDTPRHQFHLLSRLNLPHDLEFDTSLYFVDALNSQPVRDYTRVDLRLGWQPTQNLELSLVGQNLLESRHEEFESGLFSMRSRIPRSVYGMVTYRR